MFEKKYEKEIKKQILVSTERILKTKKILDDNKNLYIGAIGEDKALGELKKLPDNYYIINDFRYTFNKPVFNKKKGIRVHTVQIDHLVVSHSGIFIIETKNWSNESVNRLTNFSPFEQIDRASFGMYCLMNNIMNGSVPIRSIVLMINGNKVSTESFVKILHTDEINGYIQYFKPALKGNELNNVLKRLGISI